MLAQRKDFHRWKQVAVVAKAVEVDESFDPEDVSRFGAAAIVAKAHKTAGALN